MGIKSQLDKLLKSLKSRPGNAFVLYHAWVRGRRRLLARCILRLVPATYKLPIVTLIDISIALRLHYRSLYENTHRKVICKVRMAAAAAGLLPRKPKYCPAGETGSVTILVDHFLCDKRELTVRGDGKSSDWGAGMCFFLAPKKQLVFHYLL